MSPGKYLPKFQGNVVPSYLGSWWPGIFVFGQGVSSV